MECSDRITTSGASSGGGTIGGTVSSGESRSGNSTTNGVAGSLELDIEQFTDYNNDSRCFQGNSGPAYAEVQPATMSQTIVGEGNKTYVRVTPVDSFSPFTDYPLNHQMISTQSAIQSGFHTFHPRGGSRMAMRNEGKLYTNIYHPRPYALYELINCLFLTKRNFQMFFEFHRIKVEILFAKITR